MTLFPEKEAGGFTPLFPADDVPRIIEAVHHACVGLQKRDNRELEDRITARVWKQVQRIEPFRDGPLGIELQSAVLDTDSEKDSPEGRADLKVTCGRGPDVYFAIEAKRLRVHHPGGRFKSGSPEYVEDGMMRFVSGQYAPRMSAGAMLGYVLDGDVPAARKDVSKAVEQRRERLRLRDGAGLRRATILPTHAIDETVHDTDGRELTLFHLLVAV